MTTDHTIFTSESWQSLPNEESAEYPYKQKSGFILTEDSLEALRNQKPSISDDTMARLESDGFWELIITSYNEQHAEAYQVAEVLSDTYAAFAFGAVPVQISISGVLPMTRKEDYRLDFLKMYDSLLRGTRAQELKIHIHFFIVGTYMLLKILGINISNQADAQDYVPIELSGVGFMYGNIMPGNIIAPDTMMADLGEVA
jgi:hypothetical protein